MNKVWKIVGVAAILLILAPVGMVVYAVNDMRTVYEDPDSGRTKYGSVVFYEEAGFLDVTVEIFVRDYSLSGNNPIELGLVGNGGQGGFPEKTVWSKDGMMVAVWEHGRWTDFYDFQKHNQHLPPYDGSKKDQLSRSIQNLLSEHGGEGKIVPSQDKLPSRTPWPWESY